MFNLKKKFQNKYVFGYFLGLKNSSKTAKMIGDASKVASNARILSIAVFEY